MDIGANVRGKVDKEEKEQAEKLGDDTALALLRVEADLREAVLLTDALADLEDNFAWHNFQRILIEPALTKVKKEVARLNSELHNHPEHLSQLVYNNAFLEVLLVMSDFPAIRKDNLQKQKVLQGRVKELTKKLK
jgi:hypothetical protein